jgi:hypothetical protein
MVTSNLLSRAILGLGTLTTVLSLVEPALATPPPPVPAPIVGAGIPGLVALGGIYGAIWLTRKLRNCRKPN